tara:strand:- start:4804 stop:5661 length:858 start_codon:yes stop_codon:yes gene_type:complete
VGCVGKQPFFLSFESGVVLGKGRTQVSKNSKSELVVIVSDIHFDLHHEPTWRAFCKWQADVKPSKTIVLGDFVDLGMMSAYMQGAHEPVHAIPQIKCFVKEANKLLKHTGELLVLEGNHDERWAKKVLGAVPHVFRGALGLSLEDQCRLQGLSKEVTWHREDLLVRGIQCGPFLLRHGHKQSGRFGGGKHVAANKLAKSLGQSEIFGHHHRAQYFCHTVNGKTSTAIANPCMTGDHDYSLDPNWQRGFTVLELYGPNNCFATPYLIVMDEGHFSWRGTVYDGNRP